MPIHPTAVIDPRATIDPTSTIGPFAVIHGPVRIGPDCRVFGSAVIAGRTEISSGCQIHSHAVIGGLPQVDASDTEDGLCQIGRECIVREGATIHRGSASGLATVIGNRCMLMTNTHIGPNCLLGDQVTLISGSALEGDVQVGSRTVISGHATVGRFVRIGELSMVRMLAKIVRDVPPFFMTDQEGGIVGVNRVGLMRAGLTPAERADIKLAHRILYRSENSQDNAVEFLDKNVDSDAVRRLLDFLRHDSMCGMTTATLGRREAS